MNVIKVTPAKLKYLDATLAEKNYKVQYAFFIMKACAENCFVKIE